MPQSKEEKRLGALKRSRSVLIYECSLINVEQCRMGNGNISLPVGFRNALDNVNSLRAKLSMNPLLIDYHSLSKGELKLLVRSTWEQFYPIELPTEKAVI